jgi:hypothetical protein
MIGAGDDEHHGQAQEKAARKVADRTSEVSQAEQTTENETN